MARMRSPLADRYGVPDRGESSRQATERDRGYTPISRMTEDQRNARYDPRGSAFDDPRDRLPAQSGSRFRTAEEAFRSAPIEFPPRIPDRSVRTSGIRGDPRAITPRDRGDDRRPDPRSGSEDRYQGLDDTAYDAGDHGSYPAYASQDDYADYLERPRDRYDRSLTSGFEPDERAYRSIENEVPFASAARSRGGLMEDEYMADDRAGEAMVSDFFASIPERAAQPSAPRITIGGDDFGDFGNFEPLDERMDDPVCYDDRLSAQPVSRLRSAEEAFRSEPMAGLSAQDPGPECTYEWLSQ
nr:hypothetical protein B0A51_00128 [Rachicladosporium sp. CCFEE 5018]